MKFEYLQTRQRSPEWFAVRMGRVTASRLPDWMAVSKVKPKDGEAPKPLKARADYERELWFERKFGVSFNNYVSEAMMDGEDFENFIRKQYELIKGVAVEECGIFFNDHFAATPDGLIGTEGILEIKILRDNTFTDVLLGGVPEPHFLQIQGQLLASGRKWADYVAFNINTRKISIWRVTANQALHTEIAESVVADLTVEEVETPELYDIVGEMPARESLNLESTQTNIGGLEKW